MKILKMLLSTIFLITLIACTDKINDDDLKSIIDEPLVGYIYDDNTSRYINEDNGIWYIRENEKNIIPKEEFVEKNSIINSENFIIENRENSVWELSEIQEVIVEVRDTFYSLADESYSKHYRMDKDWYYEQVKKLNNLDDIDIIQWHDPFKLPIYIDSKE